MQICIPYKTHSLQENEITEDLKPFVNIANIVDMLDFKRISFDKAISLNPSKKVEIESK